MCISQSVIFVGILLPSSQAESNHLTTNVNYSSISIEFKANTSGINARMITTKANAQSEFLKTVNTSNTIKQTRNANNPHIINHQLSEIISTSSPHHAKEKSLICFAFSAIQLSNSEVFV